MSLGYVDKNVQTLLCWHPWLARLCFNLRQAKKLTNRILPSCLSLLLKALYFLCAFKHAPSCSAGQACRNCCLAFARTRTILKTSISPPPTACSAISRFCKTFWIVSVCIQPFLSWEASLNYFLWLTVGSGGTTHGLRSASLAGDKSIKWIFGMEGNMEVLGAVEGLLHAFASVTFFQRFPVFSLQ